MTYNTCQNCGAGQSSNTGGGCTKCPTGKAAVAGQAPCAKCATGKYVVRSAPPPPLPAHLRDGLQQHEVTSYTDQQHQASCKLCSNKYANRRPLPPVGPTARRAEQAEILERPSPQGLRHQPPPPRLLDRLLPIRKTIVSSADDRSIPTL